MDQRVAIIVALVISVNCILFYTQLVPKRISAAALSGQQRSSDNQRLEEAEPSAKPVQSVQSQDDYYRSFLKKQLTVSENSYQEYRRRRKEFVGSDPTKVNPWTSGRLMYFWDYFLPSFSCPYSITRVGGFGDGGKWICGMELYEKEMEASDNSPTKHHPPCIMYSFGIGGQTSFEDEFLKRTNCEIWGYDASVNGMGQPFNPRVHFHKVFITSNGSSTLRQLMKQNGHTWIDFVKMDIEGQEFPAMENILDEFEELPWAHLNLEIHGDQNGTSFPMVYKMWERFEDKGLRPFKNEINHHPCAGLNLRPFVAEYSFINVIGRSRLVPYQREKLGNFTVFS